MSFPVKHICGYKLEKSSSLHPAGGYYKYGENDGDAMTPITYCPGCGEVLCDTDMTDLDGIPLPVFNQSDWSMRRRKVRGWFVEE